jgi:Tetratricopeptide repeat.
MLIQQKKRSQILSFVLMLVAFSALASSGGASDSQNVLSQQRKLDYFYYEGLKLKNSQKYDAAYDMFAHSLAIDSTSAPVLYELATFYIESNRLEKASQLLKRAVANDSDNFTYRMTLASVFRGLGELENSVAEFDALSKLYPEKIELHYYLAESLIQQGEISKAIDAYNALELVAGMSEALSMQKYRLYSNIDKPEEAFGEIVKLAEKYSMISRYQIILGDLRLEQGEPDKALEYYQKAKEIEPENPQYIVAMANYYDMKGDRTAAETQIHNALINENLDVETKISILSRYIMRTMQAKGEYDTVDALFQILLEQHPEDTQIKMMYASLLIAQQKMEDAKFQIKLVTEMEPENVSAWQQLLSLSLSTEDLETVIDASNRCIELFPDVPEYSFYLGLAYYQQKEYEKALGIYTERVETIPDDNFVLKSTFYAQIGDIHYQMDNFDEAFASYDLALKHNDKNAMVLNNYSYFLALRKQDLKRAERMSAQAIKLEPNNSTYLDTYAWIFFVQGNYSLAKIYMENALSHDATDSYELYDHYGDILYMNGDKEGALKQWKRAKELGKEGTVIDRKIEEGTYIEE